MAASQQKNCLYVEGETGSTNIGRFKWLIRRERQQQWQQQQQQQHIITHLIWPDLVENLKKKETHSQIQFENTHYIFAML